MVSPHRNQVASRQHCRAHNRRLSLRLFHRHFRVVSQACSRRHSPVRIPRRSLVASPLRSLVTSHPYYQARNRVANLRLHRQCCQVANRRRSRLHSRRLSLRRNRVRSPLNSRVASRLHCLVCNHRSSLRLFHRHFRVVSQAHVLRLGPVRIRRCNQVRSLPLCLAASRLHCRAPDLVLGPLYNLQISHLQNQLRRHLRSLLRVHWFDQRLSHRLSRQLNRQVARLRSPRCDR